jgi:hypothetical protein
LIGNLDSEAMRAQPHPAAAAGAADARLGSIEEGSGGHHGDIRSPVSRRSRGRPGATEGHMVHESFGGDHNLGIDDAWSADVDIIELQKPKRQPPEPKTFTI